MSKARGLLPMAIATAIGIGTGLFIFDPAFKEEKERKEQEQHTEFHEQHSPTPEEQVRKTEEMAINAGGAITIPTNTPRWPEIQAGQFSKPANPCSRHQVPLDQYSPPEKSS